MDAFYTLSQLAITMAGFAALFSIIKLQKSEWNELDILNLMRFYVMIELACLIAIYCFLPVIFSGYLSDDNAYRLSFALFFVMWILYRFFMIRRNMKILGKRKFSGLADIIFRLLALIAALFALMNVFGLVGSNYKSNYLSLMLWVLIFNMAIFIRLIYFSINTKGKKG